MDSGCAARSHPSGRKGAASLQTQRWEKTWRARDPGCVATEIAGLRRDHVSLPTTASSRRRLVRARGPHDTLERIKETLLLAEAHGRDFAHVLAIAPRPYASRWKDLEPHVVAKGWRRSHLIDPELSPVRPERRGRAAAPESKGSAVVKPAAMTLREVDDAIIDCDRECYFESGKQLLAVKAGFRQDNV